jgi:hypothetical protein
MPYHIYYITTLYRGRLRVSACLGQEFRSSFSSYSSPLTRHAPPKCVVMRLFKFESASRKTRYSATARSLSSKRRRAPWVEAKSVVMLPIAKAKMMTPMRATNTLKVRSWWLTGSTSPYPIVETVASAQYRQATYFCMLSASRKSASYIYIYIYTYTEYIYIYIYRIYIYTYIYIYTEYIYIHIYIYIYIFCVLPALRKSASYIYRRPPPRLYI